MQLFQRISKNANLPCFLLLPSLLFVILLISCKEGHTQSCPPNIDFESGTFGGWTCYRGRTAEEAGKNVISLFPSGGPGFGHHAMYNAPSAEVDPFGGFPVICPNGSGHSIKLGSTKAGGEAEGVSYEFTIPENQNSYTLTYNYAVVFQSPNHQDYQQPRMEIEVINVTDNTQISCASQSFIASGRSLPGFLISRVTDTITVLYKNWSTASVDLSGNAGKTIRLFFKTADCTFRRHFGYAYIDVNSECSGNFVGATFCPDDTAINVVAPAGFRDYTWYDSSLTQVLGRQQLLTLSPPPASGTTLAVKMEPYEGYGCSTTKFTTLRDSLTVTAHAGKDTLSCNLSPVLIGVAPREGLRYTWTPQKGLSNPHVSNPQAAPDKTTTYIVATTNSGGGCPTTDSVLVRASIIDDSLQLIGTPAFCAINDDSAVLRVSPTDKIQWFKDNIPLAGSNKRSYRVNFSGTYFALLENIDGCSIPTRKQSVIIDNPTPGIAYPVQYSLTGVPLSLQARQIGENVLWKPGLFLDTQTSFTPVFSGERDQLYTIEIFTLTGCLTVDTQLVRNIKEVKVYVPTAFTPNKDGRNDILRPALLGLRELRFFRVFNRLGQLLYETKKSGEGWDGSFKGIEQSPQTVVWTLEGIGLNGVVQKQKGTAVLIR
ncbi:MAG: hypothetical protein AVDCRST_MAG96-3215 [uncultured Segetibacter sp.]|uniref:Ig-like domain-containing protein n=1 Tax=uncultured Segetibacter sp. TaxID=481133 RepID=A0A6J4TKR7_9BACT|nr:MAG: hypothetical protein AVDCRST_MAG96-3215 [uncultured Segetibacter sp.]